MVTARPKTRGRQRPSKARLSGDDKARRLVDILRLFYVEHETQADIAEKTKISVQHVGRLLKEARNKGLVEIRIMVPHVGALEALRARLLQRFPCLREAFVLPASDNAVFDRRLCAQAASGYFEKIIKAGTKSVAIGGGNTLFDMVAAIPSSERNIEIFPTALMGRGPHILLPDRIMLVNLLWAKCGRKPGLAHYVTIAPFEMPKAAEDPMAALRAIQGECQSLLGRPAVRGIYEEMKAAECVFTTVGCIEENEGYRKISPLSTLCKLERSGITSKWLSEQGVVGEVSYEFFDEKGETRPEWNLAIGLGVSHLKRLVGDGKQVVMIANKYKESALKAALESGMCNVIFTDENTAKTVVGQGADLPAERIFISD